MPVGTGIWYLGTVTTYVHPFGVSVHGELAAGAPELDAAGAGAGAPAGGTAAGTAPAELEEAPPTDDGEFLTEQT